MFHGRGFSNFAILTNFHNFNQISKFVPNFTMFIKFLNSSNFHELVIQDFFDNPYREIAWCDFVISRAGAISISEVTSLNKGMVLVPLENSVDNHQYFNAKYVEENNMGCLIEEKEEIESFRILLDKILKKERYIDWQKESSINHFKASEKIIKYTGLI